MNARTFKRILVAATAISLLVTGCRNPHPAPTIPAGHVLSVDTRDHDALSPLRTTCP